MELQCLRAKYFVTQPDEDFFCTICNSVMQRPHSCQDGHSFCYDCIAQWLRTSNTCPCDRESLSIGTLTFNRHLHSLITKMKVWCLNHKFEDNGEVRKKRKAAEVSLKAGYDTSTGCDWMGSLGELEAHLANDCGLTEVKCCFDGCDESMQRRNLEIHKEECNCRLFVCPHCSASVPFKLRKIHLKTCDRVKTHCMLECGALIEKRQREEHNKECPLISVNCPYSSLGCAATMLRRDLANHMSDSNFAHMDLILAKVSQIEKDNAELRGRGLKLEGGNSSLVSGTDRLAGPSVVEDDASHTNDVPPPRCANQSAFSYLLSLVKSLYKRN